MQDTEPRTPKDLVLVLGLGSWSWFLVLVLGLGLTVGLGWLVVTFLLSQLLQQNFVGLFFGMFEGFSMNLVFLDDLLDNFLWMTLCCSQFQ